MAGEGLDDELAGLRFEIEHQLQQPQMQPPSAYGQPAPGQDGWPSQAPSALPHQQQQHGMGGPPPRRGGRGAPLAPGSKNVVCIHYLVGMCALDKDCPYLHQYDLDRVPICP
jgi:hypothetical protein